MCLDAKTGKRVWHSGRCTMGSGTMTFPPLGPRGHHGQRPARRSLRYQAGVRTCSIGSVEVNPWPIEERPVPQGNVPGECARRRSRSDRRRHSISRAFPGRI
jgi:hypothetical protein